MKIGDKVVIFNKSSRYLSKASITQLIENKVYGIVTNIRKVNNCNELLDISFKDSLKINHTGYDHTIESIHCKLVTDSKEADKRNLLFNKKRNLLLKSVRDSFRVYEKLGNRRRIITTKDIVNSQIKKLDYNFVELGSIINEKFIPSQFQSKAQCCSFTKTKQDLRVYIPKVWVNTFGYNEINILTYLEFLKKCEINFDYKYEGLKELPLTSPLTVPINSLEDDKFFYETNSDGDINSVNRIVPKKEEFYSIIINKGNSSMETYLKFICVRYLYNNQYWSIPATAIQIKDALKDKITYLQAFLMAHMRYPYYEYYSLIHAELIVDIFQKPTYFLNKLGDGGNMNESFQYKVQTPTSSRIKIQNLLEEQKYEEALTILENYK